MQGGNRVTDGTGQQSQVPGLPMTMGEAGIEATAAERDELVEATR